MTNLTTNKIIQVVKHAKTLDFSFSVSSPIFSENKEGFTKNLEIQVTSHIDPELDVLDGNLDNIKNQPLRNYLKHLERNDMSYTISTCDSFATVTSNIELAGKEQGIAVLEATQTLEEFKAEYEAEPDDEEDDYYEPDPYDR